MPQTVADLVLGTSVDPSGITAGLQSVSAQIERTLAKSATVQTGANLADSIISGLAGRFSQEQEELAEQVAKGIISPGAFATASAVAVDEFKHGLSAGLGQLAVGGQMTDSIREQFEAAYGAAGAAAGEAFTRSLHAVTGQTSTLISGLQIPMLKADATQALVAEERAFQAALLAGNLDLEQRIRVTQELTRVQDALAAATQEAAGATSGVPFALGASATASERLAGSVRRTADEFFGLGARAGHAAVGISFALADLAQNADSAQGPIREILHSVSLLAIGFGEPGLLVSAIAAGTDAIIGIFSRTREEMEKTQKDFTTKLQQMQDQADIVGLTGQLQQVLQGQPHAGPSALVPKEFAGGLDDLRAKLADTQRQLDNITTADLFTKGLTFPQQLKDQIADLNKQIEPLAAQEKALRDAILSPAPPLRVTPPTPPVTTQALTGLEALQATVDRLTASAPLATAALAQLPDAFIPLGAAQDRTTIGAERFVDTYNRDALAAFDAVQRRIAAQGGAVNDTTAKLAGLRQQLAGLDVVKILRLQLPTVIPTVTLTAKIESIETPPTIAPVTLPLSFDERKLQDLGKQASDLADAIQATQAAGLSGATTDLLRQQHDVLGQLTDKWRDYIKQLIAGGASAAVLAKAFKLAKDERVDLAQGGTSHLADDLHKAGDAASRIGQAFHDDVVTGIGAALDAVGNLKSAIDTLKAPDLNLGAGLAAVGEIGSAVGGIFSAIASAFGPSQADIERNKIIQENNQALATLTNSLNKFGETGGSLDAIQRAVAHLDVGRIAGAAAADSAGGVFKTTADIDELNRELQNTGITFAQLEAEAKTLGITLTDSAGNLIPSSLDAFQKAIGATAFSLTHLSQAFDEQQKASDLLRRAQGNTDPLAALEDAITNFKNTSAIKPSGDLFPGPTFPGSGSQLFDSFFAGIDVTTKAGQQQFRDAIARMVEEIKKGDITLAELGKFENVQQLEDALGGLLDDLDAFGNSVNAATSALLNVPQGFKVALARFEATIPTIPAPVSPGAPPPETIPQEPTILVPPPITTPTPRTFEVTFDTASGMATGTEIGEAIAQRLAPLLSQASGRDFMQDLANELAAAKGGDTYNVDVTIDGSTLTADEIFQAVVTAAQRKARALFGNTTRAAETLNF